MKLLWRRDEVEHSIVIGPERREVFIGRHVDCDIRVEHVSVAPWHARFTWTPAGVTLAPLTGDAAGTSVGGWPLGREPAEVRSGQAVRCAGLQILLDGGPRPDNSSPSPTARATFVLEDITGRHRALVPGACYSVSDVEFFEAGDGGWWVRARQPGGHMLLNAAPVSCAFIQADDVIRARAVTLVVRMAEGGRPSFPRPDPGRTRERPCGASVRVRRGRAGASRRGPLRARSRGSSGRDEPDPAPGAGVLDV